LDSTFPESDQTVYQKLEQKQHITTSAMSHTYRSFLTGRTNLPNEGWPEWKNHFLSAYVKDSPEGCEFQPWIARLPGNDESYCRDLALNAVDL